MATLQRPVIIESCVETLEEALLAEQKGADRIELCGDLAQDGLTPSPELIASVHARLTIPIKVMIRPHNQGFVYNAADKIKISKDLEMVAKHGITDLVYGSLKEGRLDLEDIKQFYLQSQPTSLTIHKAIDQSTEPMNDVLELVKWAYNEGIRLSILSSGQAATAMEGIARLQRMQRHCGGVVELIVAGKVTPANLAILTEKVPAPAFHGRRIL